MAKSPRNIKFSQELQRSNVRMLNDAPCNYATRRITQGGQGHRAFKVKAIEYFIKHRSGEFRLYINKKNPDYDKFMKAVNEVKLICSSNGAECGFGGFITIKHLNEPV